MRGWIANLRPSNAVGPMLKLRLPSLFAVGLLISGCSWLAIATAPSKIASTPNAQAKTANDQFWAALHNGRYSEIDNLLEQHMRVVNKDAAEPVTLAHIGFLHSWKLAERNRAPAAARVIEHATLSRRYFDEAVRLDPTEARFLGFAASFTMTEGTVLKSERDIRKGYFMMKDAVAMWPEFNLFTSGYTMSGAPVDGAAFKEGLEQQWTTLDLCFGERVSRKSPDISRYLALETTVGPKRACWNSWIAAHNWEGFFLNFGDMLVRAGDRANAQTMYQATQLSKTYANWPYRDVLERRLANLDALQQKFANASDVETEMVTMTNSTFACMACHQKTGNSLVSSR